MRDQAMQRSTSTPTEAELGSWLTERVATYLQRNPDEIDADVPLSDYGLDSVYALTLSGDIEDRLSIPVEPSILWDNPSIRALLRALMVALTAPVTSSAE